MPTAGSLDLPSFGATVGHRAGAGGSAQWRGEQRHHARAARKAGAALRDVSTGVDSAPRGIDRPRLQVPHRPAACSCERRWRRAGGTRAGGSLRSRGARVGGRRVRTQAGLLRARERPAGSGGAGVHARWRSAEGRRLVGTQSSRAAGRPFASVRARAAPRPYAVRLLPGSMSAVRQSRAASRLAAATSSLPQVLAAANEFRLPRFVPSVPFYGLTPNCRRAIVLVSVITLARKS